MIKAKSKFNLKYLVKSFYILLYISAIYLICGIFVNLICFPLNKFVNHVRHITSAKYKDRTVYLQLQTNILNNHIQYHINKLSENA